MFRPRKLALVLALTVTAAFALAPRAAAGWVQFYKAELRVAGVGPSGIGSQYVRLVFTNTGSLGSGPCYVRITVQKPTPVVKYYLLQAMPASSGLGTDVWLGTSIQSSPGLITRVEVDCFNQVPEYNESNNTGYYVAPPW